MNTPEEVARTFSDVELDVALLQGRMMAGEALKMLCEMNSTVMLESLMDINNVYNLITDGIDVLLAESSLALRLLTKDNVPNIGNMERMLSNQQLADIIAYNQMQITIAQNLLNNANDSAKKEIYAEMLLSYNNVMRKLEDERFRRMIKGEI